ncbi:MAG: acetyltransferase, partial [Desulfobacula sp.]|nr:acetyltransferase [Desulfobacula sp.]
KQLRANPKLKGKDIESTKKACQKFKTTPVSIMNFVEGTRFTVQKRNTQNSPFHHLLKPKAGGVAFVMSAMGEYLNQIIDITIVYPERIPTFWDYSCGRVKKIIVNIDVLPITDALAGDYFSDPAYKAHVFNWLNVIWQKKDKQIESLNNQISQIKSDG